MEQLEATNLPALCDNAIRDLAEVKSIGECLKIRNVMEAARVYAAKHRMAQEAQDTCTKIVVLAERRIGQELIAAQQRGELATRERHPSNMQVTDANLPPITLEEIGIDKMQARRFRELAELDDDEMEDVAASAALFGKALKKADFKRRAATKRGNGTPAIPPTPPHLSHFSLWLRNGSRIVSEFMDHREAMSLCGRYGIALDPEQVRVIMEFLAALSAGLEADRAA